jgi:hypothetical protein
MSFLDNFTEEQQALLIELVHQKFLDKSLHQQPARLKLQEEDIPSEDDDGQGSQTRHSQESDDDNEDSQYCFSDEESEKDNIHVCS